MSTEKKLTAVEWLLEQLEFNDSISMEEIHNIFEQAKEKEKQQIIEACNAFGNLNGVDKEDFEQYYNETYKK